MFPSFSFLTRNIKSEIFHTVWWEKGWRRWIPSVERRQYFCSCNTFKAVLQLLVSIQLHIAFIHFLWVLCQFTGIKLQHLKEDRTHILSEPPHRSSPSSSSCHSPSWCVFLVALLLIAFSFFTSWSLNQQEVMMRSFFIRGEKCSARPVNNPPSWSLPPLFDSEERKQDEWNDWNLQKCY